MSSIRFFRTFVAVARSGSFAAASERVSLTPAAVSLQMRALEDDLGLTLFDRSGKIVSLSESGHRLLPRAEQLLALYDDLRDGPDGDHEVVGSINVGAVATSMAFLARAVLILREAHPKLKVQPAINFSGDLSLRVRAGELDAALAVKNAHKLPAGTQWTPLYTEPFVFIANRQSAGRADIGGLMKRRLFLRPSRSTHTGALIDAFVRRNRLRFGEFLEINSLRTMVELVQQDVGITIVPLTRAARWEDDPRLRVTYFDDPTAHRAVGLFESEARSHLTSALRRVLLDTIEQDDQLRQ
ncbi:HTH-type transcriptional activator CmpR [compost metagenome]|uniref:HTH-type transcriptional activator CmpR n=1 Tax=Achromobacter agilis TaxID=1353888 RepID=A0A446CI58_9BURK|nr:LysR substrate-binding domain-containing protein [Achromobacter agilis]SSW67465.1 HTH-type transcriptional activator CmpR [Achromobacter agilis]